MFVVGVQKKDIEIKGKIKETFTLHSLSTGAYSAGEGYGGGG